MAIGMGESREKVRGKLIEVWHMYPSSRRYDTDERKEDDTACRKATGGAGLKRCMIGLI